MANVYVEARPKGQAEGGPIKDYVVADHKDHVLKTFKTQKEAIDWAKKEGHHPLVARVRHESNKTKPDHWREAASTHSAVRKYPGAATGEEGRFFARLGGLVPLSETIKTIDYRFGEDSDGAPAVWITILTKGDVNPSTQKVAELSRAADTLRAAVLNSGFKRWPYVHIKTE